MKTIALPWAVSPAILLRRLVRYGWLPAFAFALAADTRLFDVQKECRGSFSSAFSSDFDLRRCKLTIKGVGADFKISVPLPGN